MFKKRGNSSHREEIKTVILLQLGVKFAIKQSISKSVIPMPVKASKKARQNSALELDEYPNTSFQKIDTGKNGLTEEQIVGITQQVENNCAEKVKDEIRRTENTILKAPSFLSGNVLGDDITSLHVEVSSEERNTSLCLIRVPRF